MKFEGKKILIVGKTLLAKYVSELLSDSAIAVISADENNFEDIVSQVDVVIDCAESVTAHYFVSKVCTKLKKPWIYGAVFEKSGVVLNLIPGKVCFECVYELYAQPVPKVYDKKIVSAIAAQQVKNAVDIIAGEKVSNDFFIFENSKFRTVPTEAKKF